MSQHHTPTPSPWIGLSQAAAYLGVHFTTLRRWADAGEVACMRTPGGRRRFRREDLDAFLARRHQPATSTALAPLERRALDMARQGLASQQDHPESWLVHSGETQREYFRDSGRKLFGLLLQFSTRPNGESYLEEGRRIGSDHGAHCSQAGLSITETVQAFFFFRRSFLSAIHESGTFDGPPDVHSLTIYQRASDFLDNILLATIESYHRHSTLTAVAGS